VISDQWSVVSGQNGKVWKEKIMMTQNYTEGRWTIAEQIEARRVDQAYIRLQADVRRAAQVRGAKRGEANALAEKARVAFRIVNGEAQAFGADGKTALRNEAGALLTVKEWVEMEKRKAESGNVEKPPGTAGPSPAPMPERKLNPFRRSSWNLTEQMRLQRTDPELAAKLRDAADIV
jgi:hypothetical protein